ncbi:MAG: DUF86 domain-containing protein [Bacteroidetes bacterium]|nr:DUF86 domain-containing protein [Bacteroidota bacterium]
MDIEIKTWLYDILNAINEIESFLSDRPKDFAVYQKDIRTKRAIERNVEIIGEAMNRILNRDSATKFSESRKIVDTRNRIIHGYDTVSDEIIWSIVIKYLPVLKIEIQNYLKD